MTGQFSWKKLRNTTIEVLRRQKPSTNAQDGLYLPCVDRMLEACWVEGCDESLPRHTRVWQKKSLGASLHPRWCRFSPHREVALHWMSIPGEDNSQSITLILCSLDHSQWGGLHVYLNMIIVVNNLFYFLFLFMIILLCFGKSPLYFVVVCCVGRIGPPCYDGARGRCVCWWWCCCG